MAKEDWSLRPLDDELGEALRAELLSWPAVTLRPMMGTLGFWRGQRMLGCYANRDLSKRKPAWLNRPGEPTLVYIRLREDDAARALRQPSVAPARPRARARGGVPPASGGKLEESLRRFGVAFE